MLRIYHMEYMDYTSHCYICKADRYTRILKIYFRILKRFQKLSSVDFYFCFLA